MLKYFDLQQYTAQHREQLQEAVRRVVDSGWYLLGNEVNAFAKAYAQYIGTAHCVACGNGLDALSLIFKATLRRVCCIRAMKYLCLPTPISLQSFR